MRQWTNAAAAVAGGGGGYDATKTMLRVTFSPSTAADLDDPLDCRYVPLLFILKLEKRIDVRV